MNEHLISDVKSAGVSIYETDAKGMKTPMDAVVQKHLSDPKRLHALITNLTATPEERSYAITQLSRSGAAAIAGRSWRPAPPSPSVRNPRRGTCGHPC